MDASLETLVIAGYVFATSLRIARPGPQGLVTDPELVALAVAQAITGLNSDRQFLGAVGKLLPGFFPHLPDQTQYNRRLRRLTGAIATVQMMVAELIAEDPVRLVDGTLIACANYPGCASHSEFAPDASYGYCPSKSLFVWGMRLVVICDIKGVPVGYDLVGPKTGDERESAFTLATAHPGSLLFADGGFWGREYDQTMALIDVHLVTPNKHQLGKRPPERDRESPHPARHRIALQQPQTPNATRRPPRQNHPRARPTHRRTPPRPHHRHAPQHPTRPAPTRTRRPRQTINPHQASRPRAVAGRAVQERRSA